MAYGDDFRKQYEQLQRLFAQLSAPVSSSFLELTRVIEEQEERYKTISRALDAFRPIQISNPLLVSAGETLKSLSVPQPLSPALADAVTQQAEVYSVLSSRLQDSFRGIFEAWRHFSALPPELRQPAWAGVATAFEDARAASINDLRAVVSDENALEELSASFPAPPDEGSDDKVVAWLDAVADWLDQLIGFVPPKSRSIAVVRLLLATVMTLSLGLVTNRISKELDDAREAPAIEKKAELEARRHHELDEKLGRISKQFEDFAAREQFPARVVKRAPVRAEANSRSKRLGRLEPETQVQVLSRKGSWYEVQYGGGDVGWVFGANLKRVDADTPSARPGEPTR